MQPFLLTAVMHKHQHRMSLEDMQALAAKLAKTLADIAVLEFLLDSPDVSEDEKGNFSSLKGALDIVYFHALENGNIGLLDVPNRSNSANAPVPFFPPDSP